MKRSSPAYTKAKLQEIQSEKAIFSKHIAELHPHQLLHGKKIAESFMDDKILAVGVVAPTQSGKTGMIYSAIKHIKNSKHKNLQIPYKNIIVATPLSDISWLRQTKARMPPKLRVIHRPDLEKVFEKIVKGQLSNVLLFLDEAHTASKIGQTLHYIFDKYGLYDENKTLLYKHNIKMVQITATPEGLLRDIEEWGDAGKLYYATPGKGYVSCFDLVEKGMVKEFEVLFGGDDEKLKELRQFIKDKYKTPRYHFIRMSTRLFKMHKAHFLSIFSPKIYDVIIYDMKDDRDINKIISKKITKHTFILLKEKLRCAKTLSHKKNLGVMYERYSTTGVSTIIQGLLGRCTGYDTKGCDFTIFTSLKAIEKYKKLCEMNFIDKKNRLTFNNNLHFEGYSKYMKVKREVEIKEFDTYSEACQYNKDVLKKKRNPRMPEQDEKGFYLATIHKDCKVWTLDEIKSNSNSGIRWNNDDRKFYICYRDRKDKKSIVYVIIHQKN